MGIVLYIVFGIIVIPVLFFLLLLAGVIYLDAKDINDEIKAYERLWGRRD